MSFWIAPVQFGLRPIPTAVAAGARLFHAKKKPESVWDLEDVGVGSWFNGTKKEKVERVIWLSPLAVSRRLGYLQAEDGWPEEVLLDRWREARHYFGGRLTFVARLCAFPKTDIFDGDTSPSTPDFGPIAPTLQTPDRSVALEQTVLEERGSLDRAEALPDWITHPAFLPLQGVLDHYESAGYSTGSYRSRLLLLTAPLDTAPKFRVVITSPGKQRVAEFQVMHESTKRRSR